MTRRQKAAIPKALREATWLHYNGNTFESKCYVTWCTTVLTPFSYEVGHNVPESAGGTLDISNLRPICAKCNRSMAASYTIEEFSALSSEVGHEGGNTYGYVPVKTGFFKKLCHCL